jgi:exocyst complex component 8
MCSRSKVEIFTLRRTIFDITRSYAEFVLISKEIGVLENEMLELKESLAEWKSMPSLLHIDESASAAGASSSTFSFLILPQFSLTERRRNARSSIADLRLLYANQMQTLHSQIEGSAKFAPTTPGRHVITEMDGILELNAATYKVDHGVRIVVLDDAVLVAKRRKNRNASGKSMDGKLVAERCWPLNEMLVLDTKDSPSEV